LGFLALISFDENPYSGIDKYTFYDLAGRVNNQKVTIQNSNLKATLKPVKALTYFELQLESR